MKQALLIAYYFPPIGGPGVFRSLKFVKYLPACGWQPTVIAGHHDDPDFTPDESLVAEIPSHAQVHRFDFPWRTPWRRTREWLFGHRLGRLGHTIGFFLDFPCRFREWSRLARDCAVRLALTQRPEVLYTTAPPFSAHTVGLELKRRFGLPWVADFRDPWVKNSILMEGMPPWMMRRHARAERDVLHAADHVLVVSDFMKDDFVQRCGLPPQRITTLPNGFDPGDFPTPTPVPVVNGRVRVVNTGSYYGAYNPQPLRDALATAVRTAPGLLEQMELVFVGGTPVPFDDLPGLAVRVLPRVSHRDALAWQQQAHVLLLVWTSAVTRQNVSGKIFEYLAARRPVLAVVPPDGAAADIIRQSGVGVVVSPDDPPAVLAALQQCLEVARAQRPPFPRHEAGVARFSRQRLTEELAGIFERLVG